jgi:hypothetical protein
MNAARIIDYHRGKIPAVVERAAEAQPQRFNAHYKPSR